MTYDIISTRVRKTIRVKNPVDIFPILRRYAKSRQEQFITITLNGAHEVIAIHLTTIGLVNRTIVHPREVFYHAIRDNACAIMVGHNHPSGNLTPSGEDREITERILETSKIIGIYLLDHIVFNKDTFFSIRKETDWFDD